MGNFNKFDRPRENRGFGGNRGFGDRGDAPRQMFNATCSQCGKECEVPFKPSGQRPVFCKDCFKTQQGSSAPRFSPGEARFPAKSFAPSTQPSQAGITKAQFESLSAKVDKILSMLTTNMAHEMATESEKPAVAGVKIDKKTVNKAAKPASKAKAKAKAKKK